MTTAQWGLIAALALGAYGLRVLGLVAGAALQRSPRLKAALDEAPGCLLAALIAASLASGGATEWLAAAVALAAAVVTNHVLATMGAGLLAFVAFEHLVGAI